MKKTNFISADEILELTKIKPNVIFEKSFNIGDWNYLVIFGRHINGYFCAIPNLQVSCEMGEPNDIFYNSEKLSSILKSDFHAELLAKKIKETAESQK